MKETGIYPLTWQDGYNAELDRRSIFNDDDHCSPKSDFVFTVLQVAGEEHQDGLMKGYFDLKKVCILFLNNLYHYLLELDSF